MGKEVAKDFLQEVPRGLGSPEQKEIYVLRVVTVPQTQDTVRCASGKMLTNPEHVFYRE